jgi:carbon starvation protein
MPVMIVVLCVLAIAYRYYSAFLAARVASLDDSRMTPAVRMDDGQNYHPTNRWVLFGHHFAAISGAGPLIGPVLAAQFGYLPGLLWIVIGVCLAGAVQDFLILAASIRRGGKSLAQIAYSDIGKTAGTAATVAILFIIVIALAGLGKVVVKALGGEASALPAGLLLLPKDVLQIHPDLDHMTRDSVPMKVPAGTTLVWNGGKSRVTFDEGFTIRFPPPVPGTPVAEKNADVGPAIKPGTWPIPAGTVRLMPGSPWGTFTIAATIPIALFVGVYMSRLRRGKIIEASLLGAALVLLAVFVGGWVAHSGFAPWFDLSASQVTWSMAIYGFVAAVLPVWVLLTPRDYLSSFLKIGTIALLVIGTLIANPKFEAPAINHVFLGGGPTVPGRIFPFLFITIMCGAISGFHALVSSGTTSKMLAREKDARMIGYGAMLIEGLVGVVAMVAAASLPVQDYYAMNTDLAAVPKWHDRILEVGGGGGPEHLNVYEALTQESLRGRTGGAVTLAVGMAHIFDGLAKKIGSGAWLDGMWKYWYHFAIMFEALFILTTIDAGTRIGRFLLQEIAGYFHPSLGINGGLPSALVSTGAIVLAWVYFLGSGNFATIWAMFGIANQMLAVIALAIAAVYLVNSGKGRHAWVAVLPMALVFTTTSSAAVMMLSGQIDGIRTQLGNTGLAFTNVTLDNALLQATLIVMMLTCALIVLAGATIKVWGATVPAENLQPSAA